MTPHKNSLREFQQGVFQRLRDSSTRKNIASKLGFQVGGTFWFVNLADISEVIPVPVFVAVPKTQSWFRGVSNVRGKLYSTVDLSSFLGNEPIGPGADRRVVLINERLIEGAALLVSKMLGLRNTDAFTPDETVLPTGPWERGCFRDSAGALWHELDLVALAHETRFLEVGLESTPTGFIPATPAVSAG